MSLTGSPIGLTVDTAAHRGADTNAGRHPATFLTTAAPSRLATTTRTAKSGGDTAPQKAGRARGGDGDAGSDADADGGDDLGPVRALHAQVTAAAAALDAKTTAALQRQEADFLRAFRAHMYAVTRELAGLRARADETTAKSARDDALRTTTAERSHYRGEAVRLDREVHTLRAEVAALRERAVAAEADAAWARARLHERARRDGAEAAFRGTT